MMAGFDHLVALAGYALLFVSIFMLGVPALAAFVLALAHQRDTHPVARSHFRFQLRIFYSAVLYTVLGVGSIIGASGWALAKLIHFVHETVDASTALTPSGIAAWSGGLAVALIAAAVLFFILAAAWLLGASVFGFLRLLAGRPIGHRA